MPVEAAAITAVASASNALVNLCKYGLHYVEIPAEVEQFRHAIDNLQDSINTSKRLRRVKSHYLDSTTKAEVDGTIKRSESVLDSISRTIEECRADLQTKGTVSTRNRLTWLMQGHEAFMSRVQTLNTCIQCLSMQVVRMDAVQPPTKNTDSVPPSCYRDSLFPEKECRAPSIRKARARRLNTESSYGDTTHGSMSTLSFSTEKEVVMPPLSTSSSLPEPHVRRDNASIYSYGESSFVISTTVTDAGQYCKGDFCTVDMCPLHTRRTRVDDGQNQITPTRSLDADFNHSIWNTSSAASSVTLLPDSANMLRPTSQRRRHKSGLI